MDESDKYAKENVVKILIGNKKDLETERKVSQTEARNFAESIGTNYF